jgi:PAS domain S-box-containing protein
MEAPVRRADGQYRWILGRGQPIRDADGRILQWMGVGIDIHERREAEDALRRSEAWLSEAQRLSHTGSWAMNVATGEVVYASPEFLRITGFDPGEGIPSVEAVMARIHPEDRPGAVEDLEKGLRHQASYGAERRLVLPDGTIRHVQYAVQPVSDAAGLLVELIGTCVDVTERVLAEKALRESEERYRKIFATVGVAIVAEDFSGVKALLGDLRERGVRDFRRYLAEHPELARETLTLVQVTDANDAAVALFGASSKQEFFAALPRLTTRELEAAWEEQLVAVAEGRNSVEEVVLTTLAGEKIHTLVTIVLARVRAPRACSSRSST